MTGTDSCCLHAVLVCRACGLRFEEGIADRTRYGAERCPQCGLADAAPASELEPEAFVARHGTKFR